MYPDAALALDPFLACPGHPSDNDVREVVMSFGFFFSIPILHSLFVYAG